MYSALWSPDLRQGDIVGPLFLPSIGKDTQTLVPVGSMKGTTAGQEQHQAMLVDGKYHHLVVISHCCEFNENKRNKFLVARLQTRPGNLTDDEKAALVESNNPLARSEVGKPVAGVDMFHLDRVPGAFDDPQVAVFTSITPMPMSWKGDFYKAKVAELEQPTRELFRSKLAWFCGRDGEDIPEDEKSPPPEQETTNDE